MTMDTQFSDVRDLQCWLGYTHNNYTIVGYNANVAYIIIMGTVASIDGI